MDANGRGSELYRAYVGEEKADFYVPLFERFDSGGSRVSWNWPAFFIALFWMLYRRMYGYAAAYFFLWPAILVVLAIVTQLVLGPLVGGIVYVIGALVMPFVIVPMFANALFHKHVRDRIASVVAAAPSHEAAVQRLIGQGSTSTGVAVAIAVVVCVFGTGILAAIALPAYQDYTIRAQVTEGLAFAAPVKLAVARTYDDVGLMPADVRAIKLQNVPVQNRYVEALHVFDGKIAIRYGGSAHNAIRGRVLILTPQLSPEGSINWLCGYAQPDAGRIIDTATDVPPKYLPSSCRAPAGIP